MAQRAPHTCGRPGCPNIVRDGHARCVPCRAQYNAARDARRGSTSARGYGGSWPALRELVLNEEPICRNCRRAPSTEVDHIIPKRRGGTDDRSNLQGLCSICHGSKRSREGVGGGRSMCQSRLDPRVSSSHAPSENGFSGKRRFGSPGMVIGAEGPLEADF